MLLLFLASQLVIVVDVVVVSSSITTTPGPHSLETLDGPEEGDLVFEWRLHLLYQNTGIVFIFQALQTKEQIQKELKK